MIQYKRTPSGTTPTTPLTIAINSDAPSTDFSAATGLTLGVIDNAGNKYFSNEKNIAPAAANVPMIFTIPAASGSFVSVSWWKTTTTADPTGTPDGDLEGSHSSATIIFTIAAALVDYALTTIQRIKDKLGLSNSNHDKVLARLINYATDYIEGETNRRFKRTTYTQQLHSVYGDRPEFVLLKQAPVVSISAAEYRAGTPSNPGWASFPADNYELIEDGKTGVVRIYGGIPRGVNQTRFSYIAGYLIDFDHEGNTALHNLPADITQLCEKLVIRAFKRREKAGYTSETIEGATIAFKDDLDAEDKDTIAGAERLPAFV